MVFEKHVLKHKNSGKSLDGKEKVSNFALAFEDDRLQRQPRRESEKKSGKRQKLNAVKNAAKICMVTKTVLTLHPLFGASGLMIVKPEKKRAH